MSGREIAQRSDGPALARFERDNAVAAAEHAEELLDRETRSRRFAWIVTAVLIVVCAAQAAAIALMLPLKEIVPYTIVVDRSTGYVEAARSVELGALPEDEAVSQALLAQYVIARETFDTADLAARYKLVGLWSSARARTDYVEAYRADNPRNVVATTPPGLVRRVTVRAVRITDRAADPKRAIVDFEVRESAPGAIERMTPYRAQLGFQYSGAPMRMEDRLQNPLGFVVVAYRRDDPAPIPPAPAPSAFAPAVSEPMAEAPMTSIAPPSSTPTPPVPQTEPQP
ncbi:MAG: virB8 family protein [Caulobacterales bacterium]